MYTKSAHVYDAIYSGKDYSEEAAELRALIERHGRPGLVTLLEVGCGTGNFVTAFQEHFQSEGLDLDEGMLDVARAKHPGVVFHQGDMVDFQLGRRFDVVACLFSSIGYVGTVDRMRLAIKNMAQHVAQGGILLVEPWWTPETWHTGKVGCNFVDEADQKIARMWVSERRGTMSIMEMHYLIGTPTGVQHHVERHELGLFTHDEYLDALRAAGLTAFHESKGPVERGLYIGVAPRS